MFPCTALCVCVPFLCAFVCLWLPACLPACCSVCLLGTLLSENYSFLTPVFEQCGTCPGHTLLTPGLGTSDLGGGRGDTCPSEQEGRGDGQQRVRQSQLAVMRCRVTSPPESCQTMEYKDLRWARPVPADHALHTDGVICITSLVVYSGIHPPLNS